MACWNVIDHTEVDVSGIATYEETSISGSYDHLYLKASIRHNTIDSGAYIAQSNLQVSGDTGSNYSSTRILAASATPASGRVSSTDSIPYQYGGAGPSALADTFGIYELWIPNYANTSNYKQILSNCTVSNNSTTDSQWIVATFASLWASTAAITAIKLYPHASDNYVQYSTFTLYGINGAA